MHRNNFSYLLVALLTFIIIVPVAHDLGLISVNLAKFVAISSLVVVGIWSLRGAGRLFHFGMAAGAVGVTLSAWTIVDERDMLHLVSDLALLIFLALAVFNTLRQVAVGNDVSPNRIVGATCVYLMLGVMWAIAYAALEFSQPGSFTGLTGLATPTWNPDWLYFSFVTITTLGYGDILPVAQSARSLAFAEAIIGQFYIAVLVAGLVSAYISEQAGNKSQD